MPKYRFTPYFENQVMSKRPYVTKEMCIRLFDRLWIFPLLKLPGVPGFLIISFPKRRHCSRFPVGSVRVPHKTTAAICWLQKKSRMMKLITRLSTS